MSVRRRDSRWGECVELSKAAAKLRLLRNDELLFALSINTIPLSSRPATREDDQSRQSPSITRISSHGHNMLPPISIRCISGREKASQSTGSDSIATPRLASLPLSCPTTPLVLPTCKESLLDTKKDPTEANEERSSALSVGKKKKRKGKGKGKGKKNVSQIQASPKPPPPALSSSSPRPSPLVRQQFERIYHKDTSHVIPRKQDHRSPLTLTPLTQTLRSIKMSVSREVQSDAEKNQDSDGAAARAQERLEHYRRSKDEAAIALKRDEEVRRSRRRESRIALEQSKQRKREEIYATNQVMALSEAARMKLILGNLDKKENQDPGSSLVLQQRGV